MSNFTTWRSLVDGQEVAAIPDSVVAQYDATEESSTGGITSIADQVGSFDLSGSASVISNGIDGNQTFRFDGVDDNMSNDSTITNSEKFAFIFVCQQQESPGSNNFYFDGGELVEFSLQDDNDGNLELRRGGSQSLSDPATNDPHLYVYEAFDGGDVRLERDGTEIGTASLDALPLTGFILGDRRDESFALEVDYGQFEITVDQSDEDLDEIKNRLQEKWGTPSL